MQLGKPLLLELAGCAPITASTEYSGIFRPISVQSDPAFRPKNNHKKLVMPRIPHCLLIGHWL